MTESAENERALNEWYERKSKYMEDMLGKEHDLVMHAIIPFALGGGLDLFYYPNGIEGTGIATKELSESLDRHPSNLAFTRYEFVMYTRHALSLDDRGNDDTDLGKAHDRINSILKGLAPYSFDATLNPGDTCEFPPDMDDIGGACVIFDAYTGKKEVIDDFGMMLVMEVYRSEMEYAREHGSRDLFEKLKAKSHYPYSDMDREPVV